MAFFDLLVPRLTILDKNGDLSLLGPNLTPLQTALLAEAERQISLHRPVRMIVLKARQMGCSTITEAMAFQMCMVFPNYPALVLAHLNRSSASILKMTHRYWNHAPEQLHFLHQTTSSRISGLAWDNGSTIEIATAKNEDEGRGRTIQFIHCSEAAFYPNPERLLSGLNQVLPRSRRSFQIVESTANGIGDYFYDQWQAAKAGDIQHVPMFFAWWQHPYYTADYIGLGEVADRPLRDLDDEEKILSRVFTRLGLDARDIRARLIWRRDVLRTECNGDLDYFHQEYPACVVAGTRVGTIHGILPIEQVVAGTATTLGTLEATHMQPSSPTFTLTTELGYTLTGTHDHPIFTDSGVLVPLDAAEGLRIQLQPPRFAEKVHVEKWTDLGVKHAIVFDGAWGEFAGLFMGDGSFHGDCLSIVCTGKDEDLITYVADLLWRIFGVVPQVRVVGEKKGGAEIRVSRIGFKSILDQLGWLRRTTPSGKKSGGLKRKVHVPEQIWRSPKPVVAAFLRGLFEADGFNAYGSPRIVLFSKYPEFLRDVQLLLLGFGITSRFKCVVKKSSNGTEYPGYELNLRVQEALRFNQDIGWLSGRKRAVHYDRQPTSIDLTDTVAFVVPTGHIEPTYDFTVAGGQAFDANGILTHNTDDEAFISTGRNVFNRMYLDLRYEPEAGEVGNLFRSPSGHVGFTPDPHSGYTTIYRQPRPSADYMVGGDASRAAIGDYACAQVFDRRTREQVAVFHQRGLTPSAFATEMMKLGVYYNDAMLIPETNLSGGAVSEILRTTYPNVFIYQKANNVPGMHSTYYGWPTTNQTKAEVVSYLQREFTEAAAIGSGILIHHKPTYVELAGYVIDDKGKYTNGSGTDHDDTVMALGIALAGLIYEAVNLPQRSAPPPTPRGRPTPTIPNPRAAEAIHGSGVGTRQGPNVLTVEQAEDRGLDTTHTYMEQEIDPSYFAPDEQDQDWYME